MNNKLYILAFLFMLATATALAQPAPVKKAAQSLCTITTFDASGAIHATTQGVFVGNKGEVIALWNAFEGAQRATVIDAAGKSHEVDAMLGVSDIYNLCKVRIKDKAPAGIALTTSDQAPQTVYLIAYDIKKPSFKTLKVASNEKFDNTRNYLIFDDRDVENTDLGNAIVNEQGQLLGLMQRPKNGGQAFSADARLTDDFKLNGLSLNDHAMRATGIRTALPDDEQQAALTLMVAGQGNDTLRYDAYVDEYIRRFPTSTEGYKARAERFMAQGYLAQADAVFAQALKQALPKDEMYYLYASAVYRAVAYRVDTTYTRWSYPRAITLVGEAEKLSAQPIYKHLRAQIVYAQGDYAQAYELFTQLQQTELGKNGEVYYEAAQCKMQQKAPDSEIMPLLDAAVNAQEGAASAPYVLARALYLDNAGEYRKAFVDYLAYDTLLQNRATHDFYYTKYRCEMKIHQYQLALNDIAHAIVLNRTNPTYYAEMAALQLQVGQKDNCIATCNLALQLTDQYADLYILKGIAQCELGQKTEGLATLQRAKELEDERADGLIEKYSKQ